MKRGHQLALALVGILLAVVVLAPASGETRWLRTLHNSAHAPIFGMIAVLLLTGIRAHARLGALAPARQYLIAFGLAVTLGIATEVAQLPTGREASLGDVRNDALGALAFLAFFAVFDRRLRGRARSGALRATALVMSLCVLAVLVAPVARAAFEYWQRDHRFPVVADFSQRYDRYFILQNRTLFEPASLPKRWAAMPGEAAMRVTFVGEPYPGMHFIEPLPDWSAYSTLVFDVTNPTEIDLDLVLRVHDAHHDQEYHDRFNRPLLVPACTRTLLRIPLTEIQAGPATRTLDLKKVAGMALFRVGGRGVEEMYLSRVWLE